MHPGRAVKRAVTPKAVKRARRALSPIDNMKYGSALDRDVPAVRRRRKKSGTRLQSRSITRELPVNHRTPEPLPDANP
jgi:hypothetical protein